MAAPKLKKMASPKEVILMAFCLMMLAYMFHRYFYTPLVMNLKEAKKGADVIVGEKQSLKEQMASLEERRMAKQAQTAVQSSANTRIEILDGRHKPKITNLQAMLETITQPRVKNSVTLISLTAKNAEASDGYRKSSFSLEAAGTFGSIIAFMKNLDELEALLAIESLSLEADPVAKGNVNLALAASLYELEDFNEAVTP